MNEAPRCNIHGTVLNAQGHCLLCDHPELENAPFRGWESQTQEIKSREDEAQTVIGSPAAPTPTQGETSDDAIRRAANAAGVAIGQASVYGKCGDKFVDEIDAAIRPHLQSLLPPAAPGMSPDQIDALCNQFVVAVSDDREEAVTRELETFRRIVGPHLRSQPAAPTPAADAEIGKLVEELDALEAKASVEPWDSKEDETVRFMAAQDAYVAALRNNYRTLRDAALRSRLGVK